MREHPNPRHVPDLQKHFQNERDVIRSWNCDFVVRLSNQFLLGVAEQFAECGRDFDEFPARVHHRDVIRLHAHQAIADRRRANLILKTAREDRPELSHGEVPLWATLRWLRVHVKCCAEVMDAVDVGNCAEPDITLDACGPPRGRSAPLCAG